MPALLGIFAAGVVTVLSPCVLPVAPLLVGGLVATGDGSPWARVRATSWFALGFAAAFVAMGLGLSSVVALVPQLRPWLVAAGGMAVALYGLRMAGVLEARPALGWMDRTLAPPTTRVPRRRRLRALALGLVFGVTWTPCAGPILGGVLTYVAADGAAPARAAAMLLAYAAGVALPLLALAAASELVMPVVRRIRPRLGHVARATGVALVALGALPVLRLLADAGAPAPAPREVADLHASGVERLLFFYSEHCPTCRLMEAYLPAVERACGSERWRLARIDVDRAENAGVVAEADVRAVPTVSVRDRDGNERVRWVGYRSETALRDVLAHELHVACAAAEPPADPLATDGATCEVGKAC